MGLLRIGFVLEAVEEAEPPANMMDLPGMKDELRRPMLLVKATEEKNIKYNKSVMLRFKTKNYIIGGFFNGEEHGYDEICTGAFYVFKLLMPSFFETFPAVFF